MKKSLITITKSATNQFNNILRSNIRYKGFYFGIKGGGCNGFTYDLIPMSELSKKTKYDEICKINDIPIQICGHSLLHIIGTKIDWNEDVMAKKFIFENPNAGNKCGCGTSFNPKN
tara:strand:+ start:259 stop:606 length:348 start_codon:yes stop_codon:yes gene_type:complete